VRKRGVQIKKLTKKIRRIVTALGSVLSATHTHSSTTQCSRRQYITPMACVTIENTKHSALMLHMQLRVLRLLVGVFTKGEGTDRPERAKGAGHTLSRHLNHLFLYSRHCHDLMAFLKAFDRPDLRSRDCTCQR
jgi:hypothetical protein